MASKDTKKEKIMDAAFMAWGRNFFKETSLSTIMQELNMTKPALYRYFKNKNELINSMKHLVVYKIQKILNSFVVESEKDDSIDVVYSFIEKLFGFFSQNIYFFIFFLLYIVKEFSSYKKVRYFDKILFEIFKEHLARMKTWVEQEETYRVIRLIFSTGISVLINKIMNKNNVSTLSPEEIRDTIEQTYKIVKHGFGSEKVCPDINFEKIESDSSICREELVKDKILDAIASVVAKEGLWKTTISKIAKKLGFTKSSLYFHFKNKREMLLNMILREVETKNNIINKKISGLDKFEEKLYCAIATNISYLILDKRLMHVYDWLHIQNVDFSTVKASIKKTPLNEIISDGIEEGFLNRSEFSNDFMSAYLSMQIVKEVYYSKQNKINICQNDSRFIYYFFIKGISESKTQPVLAATGVRI